MESETRQRATRLALGRKPVQQARSRQTEEQRQRTRQLDSLASQPYFSSCACALGRGAGEISKGRKNTSGHLRQVFVSHRNVIIIQTIV